MNRDQFAYLNTEIEGLKYELKKLTDAAKLAREAILKNGDLSDALVNAHNALDKAITRIEGLELQEVK